MTTFKIVNNNSKNEILINRGEMKLFWNKKYAH